MKNQQQVDLDHDIAGGELGPPPASERISPPAGNDGSHGLRHLHQRETASGASAPSSHQRPSRLWPSPSSTVLPRKWTSWPAPLTRRSNASANSSDCAMTNHRTQRPDEDAAKRPGHVAATQPANRVYDDIVAQHRVAVRTGPSRPCGGNVRPLRRGGAVGALL